MSATPNTPSSTPPYDALVAYLMRSTPPWSPPAGMGDAALGPRVLELARDRSAGAHPYLTTGAHGPGPRAHRQHRVPGARTQGGAHRDAAQARESGRKTVDFYLDLSNYVNNWRRLGFTADDVARPGSDMLIDAPVAHGTPEMIAARPMSILDAGADHVAIQVLGSRRDLVPTRQSWPGPLGLTQGQPGVGNST